MQMREGQCGSFRLSGVSWRSLETSRIHWADSRVIMGQTGANLCQRPSVNVSGEH